MWVFRNNRAWEVGELCSPRTIAGGLGNPLRVPETIAVGSRRALLAAYHRGRAREPSQGSRNNRAWGVGELCSPRTIAGGLGNPLRVPETIARGESASFARRVPSREGSGTLSGFPKQSRVGSRRALLAAYHRGRAREPSQGSRNNRAWGVGELCSPRTIAGGLGNPLRVPETIARGESASFARRVPSREGSGTLSGFPKQSRVGSRRALLAAYHRGRAREPSQGSRNNRAWGVGELCSPRTIAGGLGNPLRVPETIARGESASFARRVPSREGSGTLSGFPKQSRVGSRRALLAAYHRGRAREPSQGSRNNRAWGVGELCSPRTIAGGLGNPLRVPETIARGESASFARRVPSREGSGTLSGFPKQSR